MPEFEPIRSKLSQLRSERQRREERLRTLRTEERNLEAKLAAIARAGRERPPESENIESRKNQLAGQIAEAQIAFEAARDAAREQELALGETSPMELVERLDDSTPFLLFPVRIETRFINLTSPGGPAQHELWVRIYPDDIQIDTHEPGLTDSEVEGARVYWTELWKAGPDPDGRLGAWRALVDSFGANRAMWVVEAYGPSNSADILNATTRAEPALDPADHWPEYDAKPDSWSQAPSAKLMPDRFVVTAYVGGRKVIEEVGQPIPDPLVVGMDPNPVDAGQGMEVVEDRISVPSDMRWMVDFEEAVQVGMGIRIEISETQARSGFDRLLVLGLRLSDDSDEAKTAVESLFTAHRYSPGGFSLVPVGTPTNNTDSLGSGFSSFDLGAETSYALLDQEQFSETDDWTQMSDGQRLTEWLGIDASTLKHVHHSGGFDGRDARAMNTALWPATLGYFMEEMMDTVFSAEERADAREFFIRNVWGRGSASSIRVGTQPYGILPATAWSRLSFQALPGTDGVPFEARLKPILDGMNSDWETMAGDVSYAGKDGDPYEILLDIVGLHASAAEFYQRTAVGPDYLTNYLNLGRLNRAALQLQEYWVSQGQAVLEELGYPKDSIPAIFEKTFFSGSILLDGPVVDDAPLSETDPIRAYMVDEQNYISWILESDIDTIRSGDFGEDNPAPTALLYLLLRHAVMLSYWDGAMQMHEAAGNLAAGDRKELELLHIETGRETLGKWDYLYTSNEAVTGESGPTVAAYLDGFKMGAAIRTPLVGLGQFQAVQESLGLLEDVPTARLERAFTEHLDLCSYRLDAWKQGLIQHKLESLRFHQSPGDNQETWHDGTYVGAFAWLEDLRPSGQLREEVSVDQVPEAFVQAGAPPLRQDAGNAGFIHGPSLNHAVTGAVLRNAYLTHAGEGDADLMSINLSSERVRTALKLIEGIRQGQGLAELLGYQFERGLHDRHEMGETEETTEVDKFIYSLRKAFPLYADELTGSSDDTLITAIEARNVINGIALLDYIQETGNTTYPYEGLDLETATSEESDAIDAEVDRLREALDAVGDLGLAEGVFQLIQGNYDRAAAATAALGEGHIPPVPEISDTPRSGSTLTHRCVLVFDATVDATDPSANPWETYGIGLTARAVAEPSVNLWLASVLPEPNRIMVRAEWTAEDGTTARFRDVHITDLALQPIDLVHVLGSGQTNERSEMDARIAYFVRRAESLDHDTAIRILYNYRDATWTGWEVTLFELPPLMESLRSMITEPRALGGMDLILAGEDDDDAAYTGGFDYDEIAARTTETRLALSALNDALTAARDALEAGTDEDALLTDKVREALHSLSGYGIPNTIPSSATGASASIRTSLLTHAESVLAETASKLEACDDARALITTDTTNDQKVEIEVKAGAALLGTDFRMLPVFTPNNPDELESSFASSASLLSEATTPLPVEEWLGGVSRVRPRMALWERAALMSDNFDRRVLRLDPVQLPHQVDDPWLAIEYPPEYTLSGEKLLLAVHQDRPFDKTLPQKGIVLDEWVEVVPGREETTGIAFHYDAPNSEAPQTMLLVVPPEVTGAWKWQDLTDTLNETLDMAKQRGVEPLQVDESNYAQMLPAVLMAFSTAALTVSTKLTSNLGTQISIEQDS